MINIVKKYSLKKRIHKILKLKTLIPEDTKIYEKEDLDEIMKLEKGD